MNLQTIYKNMKTRFPVKDCTIKNSKEKGIYDSDKKYLCLILDKRFTHEATLKIMKPYLWVGSETSVPEFKNEKGYGWTDKYNNYIDHYQLPIHGDTDDCFVIGFIEYNEENDTELWDLLK